MDEKCIKNQDKDCLGLRKAEEIAGEVKALDAKLAEFRQSVTGTNERFGARLGRLEARNDVQDEQRIQMKEQIAEVKADVAEFRREQKDSIAELRKENKEAMAELKQSTKEILDAVTPLKHRVEHLERVEADVEKIKAKPGQTWESIKDKSLWWVIALILAIVAVALGLGKYL
ncbi:MAG: hypothetical protein NC489_43370 [Ruminococcus flavefaciens]|nr:hypothetical protein [Ruminococcus flavefaciens]